MSEKKLPWKAQLVIDYLMQFEAATESDATIRKTSLEICQDLEDMAEIKVEEVTNAMMGLYQIGFEDNKPVWLLKQKFDKKLIKE